MSRKSGPTRRHLRPVAAAANPDRTALVDELLAALEGVAAFRPLAADVAQVRTDPTAVLDRYDSAFRVAEPATDDLVSAIRELHRDATTAFRAEVLAAHFIAGFLAADEAHRLDREADADTEDTDDSFSGLLLHLSVTTPDPAVMFLARATESVGRADQRAVARVAALRLRLAGVQEPRWSRSIGRPAFHSAFVAGSDGDEVSTLVLQFEYSHRLHALIALIDGTDWAEGGLKAAFASEISEADELRHSELVEGATVEELTQEQAAAVLDAALAVPARPRTVDQADAMLDTMPLLVARRRFMTPERPDLVAPLIRLDDVAQDAPTEVHRLRVTVKGSRPAVWRELVVDNETTILDLEQILEIALDLQIGFDPWLFEVRGEPYGFVEGEFVSLDATVDDLALRPGEHFRWTAHPVGVVDLEFVGAEEPEPGAQYPHCADGSWALPAGPGEEPRRFRLDHINVELDEWLNGELDSDDDDLDGAPDGTL